jgi:hypothetical protein
MSRFSNERLSAGEALWSFYRQSGRRLAVESSDLPPFKKSGGFQPLS